MYSTFYRYYQIQADKKLSQCLDTKKLKSFFRNFIEIKKVSDYSFRNRFWFSFISIDICYGNENGYTKINSTNEEKANLVVITSSMNRSSNEARYKRLLIKIAKFLNWELIEEDAEDDGGDYVIWCPNMT